MKVTYTPEGADPKVWSGIKKGRIMSPEAEAIERHTGLNFGQWWEALGDESMLALHGLLFVLLKRSIPTLKWDELQFCQDEVELDLDLPEEKSAVRDALAREVEAGNALTPAQQEYLDRLTAELADEASEDPKASESSDASSTPEPSPAS